MLDKILKTIDENNMIKAGDKVICALSGGADSMALLYALYKVREEKGITLYAAHLNHMIRGESAREDARFAEAFAKKLGVEFFYEEKDIPALSKERGISLEECGRNERYLFLNELSKKLDNALIATGHHKNDRAETVLFNLFRGSAVLRGIPCKRGNIIRPLVNVTKKEIENFLRENSISWRVDKTNSDTKYVRNSIRYILENHIEKNFPKAAEKITLAEERAKSDDEYLTLLAKKSGAFEKGRIDCRLLTSLHESLQRRVALEALKFWGLKEIDNKHIEDILKLSLRESGKKIDLGNNITVVKNYSEIKLFQKEEKSFSNKFLNPREPLEIRDLEGIWKLKTVDKLPEIRDNKMMIILDGEKIGELLEIRTRRDGDYMYPFGMKGKKKIKEIFIDKKIPREEREKILLLAKGEEVIFIPNIRKTGNYLPDENTKKYFIAEYETAKEKNHG